MWLTKILRESGFLVPLSANSETAVRGVMTGCAKATPLRGDRRPAEAALLARRWSRLLIR